MIRTVRSSKKLNGFIGYVFMVTTSVNLHRLKEGKGVARSTCLILPILLLLVLLFTCNQLSGFQMSVNSLLLWYKVNRYKICCDALAVWCCPVRSIQSCFFCGGQWRIGSQIVCARVCGGILENACTINVCKHIFAHAYSHHGYVS